MYRLPCRTKYNAKYNADNNAEYNTDYNTEYNAISVSNFHYREYASIDPDSDSAIPSDSTLMTIDDCNRLPNQALPIDVPYKAN